MRCQIRASRWSAVSPAQAMTRDSTVCVAALGQLLARTPSQPSGGHGNFPLHRPDSQARTSAPRPLASASPQTADVRLLRPERGVMTQNRLWSEATILNPPENHGIPTAPVRWCSRSALRTAALAAAEAGNRPLRQSAGKGDLASGLLYLQHQVLVRRICPHDPRLRHVRRLARPR